MSERLRARGAQFVLPSLAVVGVLLAVAAAQPATPSLPDLAQQLPSGFTHDDHETLQCFTCHENTAGHGALTVTTIEDCRACHHASDAAAPCARCHAAPPETGFAVVRAVSFSVPAGDARRSLAFPHERHNDLDCASCHTQGVALTVAADLDCASCHEDHHMVESDCAACHASAPVSAHPPAEVHVTCSGASCHQDVPFESVPRTRAFCLGCHGEMALHEAPLDCVTCHILPAPRSEGGR
jgi:hypothetical protein